MFRLAGKAPQQLAADAAFASFEAVVPIGAADAVTMTVRGADGSRAELAPGKIRALDLSPLAAVGTPKGEPIVAVADGVAHLAIVETEAHDAARWLAEPLDFTLAGAMGYGNPTNLVAKCPTKMQAVWTPQGVVLGITCTEPTPKLLQTTHPAGEWWGNDCLEIFVDPTGEQEGLYGKLWIDPVNQLRVLGGKGCKWKPTGLKSGVKVNADSWTVEIFIPYSDVKCFDGAKIPGTQGGMNWNGNVTRLRIADGWAKEGRTPGSVAEMQRLYARFSIWNSDPNAFGVWKFVEQ